MHAAIAPAGSSVPRSSLLNGPFLPRQVTEGHKIESEVGRCIDHFGGSRERKRGWGCVLIILEGQENESEVGLCIDHSEGSRDRKRGWVVGWSLRRVTSTKARLGCTLITPEGHEIKSDAASSPISSVLHASWTVPLRLTEPRLTTGFSFLQAQKICERVYCCFYCHTWLFFLKKGKKGGIYWYGSNRFIEASCFFFFFFRQQTQTYRDRYSKTDINRLQTQIRNVTPPTSLVTEGSAVEEISSMWTLIGILNLFSDLGLNHNREIQSFHKTIQLMMLRLQSSLIAKGPAV